MHKSAYLYSLLHSVIYNSVHKTNIWMFGRGPSIAIAVFVKGHTRVLYSTLYRRILLTNVSFQLEIVMELVKTGIVGQSNGK